jgi:protein-S-isoprenylcysteine O-methyltransferase Ste14
MTRIAAVRLKTAAALAFFAAELVVLLFPAAGTLDWGWGWAWIGLVMGTSTVVTVMLERRDPALVAERLRLPVQRGQARGDRFWMAVIGLAYAAWLPLMGLDAVRFGWSQVPLVLHLAGAAGIVACMWIAYLTFIENTFAIAAVRIQEERGQTVISSGPYARVRHPLYSGALLFFIGTPLMLGSWWGVVWGLVLSLLLARRIVLEEGALLEGLDGYDEYTSRVRFRLVPGVW